MIRILLSVTRLLVVMISALLLASCDFNGSSVKGSGNVIRQNRSMPQKFEKIVVSHGIELSVSQTDSVSVIVETDDNLQKHIITSVENGTLYISSDLSNIGGSNRRLVFVNLPIISAIEAESGSNVSATTVLLSEDLQLRTASGSEMKLGVEADRLLSESASGSHLTLEGKAIEFSAASESGSETDAGNLLANDVSAQASSGSHLTVNPILKLNASASSGGSVEYAKTPKSLIKKASSGGNISEK